MGYDWIKVSVKTPRHPKVQRLEKALGIEDGLGCAVRLWAWTAEYYPEGEFPTDARGALERAVASDLPSLRNVTEGKVTEALVTVGLIDCVDDRYEVHDWCEHEAAHADKAERDREQNRERQRRFRNRKRNAPVTLPANVTVTAARNDRPLPRGEERRGEEAAAKADMPKLVVVDESDGLPPGPPAYPLTGAFRQRLADRLARTALHPIGGGKTVWESVEAGLRVLPMDEAVEACARRVVDATGSGRRQPGTLAYFSQVIADLALAKAGGVQGPKRKRAIGVDENGQPIFEAQP